VKRALMAVRSATTLSLLASWAGAVLLGLQGPGGVYIPQGRPVVPDTPPPTLEGYILPAGCWKVTGTPLVPIPTSAYLEWRDGRTERTYRPRLVDLAFRDALGLVDPKRFDTIGLCRR
jgi:hypothetical protein